MNDPAFNPGFRLWSLDVVVLIFGAIAALAVATVSWSSAFVVGFVMAHFFLFCNVVRLARTLELAWAGVFVSLAATTIVLDVPGWVATAVYSLLVTVVVVDVEMRKPSYHGVGSRWINPGLPAWWQARPRVEHKG
jgi:hypothetical protein